MQSRDLNKLLSDESFISYCSGKDATDLAFWEAYLIANPQLRKDVEKVKRLVLFTANSIHSPDDSIKQTITFSSLIKQARSDN